MEVLKRLLEHGVCLKKEKCQFLQDSVEYLGHRIDAQGVHTSEKKPLLRHPNHEMSRNCVCSWGFSIIMPNSYRTCHPSFTCMLNNLLRANQHWVWTHACNRAFLVAKSKLVSAPVLAHYDPHLPILMASDASAYGVSAVISHMMPDGTERPVA